MRFFSLYFTFFLYWVSSLSAQITQSAKPEVVPNVLGTVVNSKTGQPIENAQIRLFFRQNDDLLPAGTISDAEGRFHFTVPRTSQFVVNVSKRGDLDLQYGAEGASRDAIKDRGNSLSLPLKLTRQGVISGVITTSLHEPIQNSTVFCSKIIFENGIRTLRHAAVTVTNDLGECRLFGLRPGRYILAAAPPQPQVPVVEESMPKSSNRIIDGFTYYGGATDPASATPISVTADSDARAINITLVGRQTFRIRGHLSGPSFVGKQHPMVFLARPDASGSPNITHLDSRNHFEILDVAPGNYFIVAISNDNSGIRRQTNTPIVVTSSDLEDVLIEIDEGRSIAGRLVNSLTGTPFEEPAARVVLDEIQENATEHVPPIEIRNSEFKAVNLARSIYRIGVLGLSGNWYLRSATVRNVVLPNNLVDLTQIQSEFITLNLSSEGGEVSGSVLGSDKKGMSSAFVAIVCAGNEGGNATYKIAEANSRGEYVFKGLPPGDYQAFAWEKIDVDSFSDPEILKQASLNGRKFKISGGDKQEVILSAIPAIVE